MRDQLRARMKSVQTTWGTMMPNRMPGMLFPEVCVMVRVSRGIRPKGSRRRGPSHLGAAAVGWYGDGGGIEGQRSAVDAKFGGGPLYCRRICHGARCDGDNASWDVNVWADRSTLHLVVPGGTAYMWFMGCLPPSSLPYLAWLQVCSPRSAAAGMCHVVAHTIIRSRSLGMVRHQQQRRTAYCVGMCRGWGREGGSGKHGSHDICPQPPLLPSLPSSVWSSSFEKLCAAAGAGAAAACRESSSTVECLAHSPLPTQHGRARSNARRSWACSIAALQRCSRPHGTSWPHRERIPCRRLIGPRELSVGNGGW